MKKRTKFVFLYILLISIFSAVLGWIIVTASLIESGVYEYKPGCLYNFLLLKNTSFWLLIFLIVICVGITAYFLLNRLERGVSSITGRTIFLFVLMQCLVSTVLGWWLAISTFLNCNEIEITYPSFQKFSTLIYKNIWLLIVLLFFSVGIISFIIIRQLNPSENKKPRGFGLVEVMIAISMMLAIIAASFTMLQISVVGTIKAREQSNASRLIDMIFSKLRNTDFFFLFCCDSSKPYFDLYPEYPYMGVLNVIKNAVEDSGFSKFTIEITFMRRDTSDADGDGLTSDLIPFTDVNGDLIDDYDPEIKYYDHNNDGDYYDTYVENGRKIAEQPDTHLKEVTVTLYKREMVVAQSARLISLEEFSGIESPASGATLSLFVRQPANATYVYNLDTTERENAFNLVIDKSYPETVVAYRADFNYPLRLWGETDPQATVHFFVNDTISELDSAQADINGDFDFQSYSVTSELVEGRNTIWAKATKEGNVSPYSPREVILDLNPPQISDTQPTGTVNDRTPQVSAIVSDSGISTDTVSGVCAEVITMKVNGETVEHEYNDETGEVIWIDTVTMSYPVLDVGTYTVVLQAGDNAYYKVSATWDFTVSISDPDNSPPSISQKTPSGSTGYTMPEIGCRVFDNQSGINPSSIVMKVDGEVVVDSSNVFSHYNSSTGEISWTPDSPYENGTQHTVEISVSHWAENPPDRVTKTDSWSFFINAF